MIRDMLLVFGEIHVARLFEMLDEHQATRREHLKTLLATSRIKPLAGLAGASIVGVKA